MDILNTMYSLAKQTTSPCAVQGDYIVSINGWHLKPASPTVCVQKGAEKIQKRQNFDTQTSQEIVHVVKCCAAHKPGFAGGFGSCDAGAAFATLELKASHVTTPGRDPVTASKKGKKWLDFSTPMSEEEYQDPILCVFQGKQPTPADVKNVLALVHTRSSQTKEKCAQALRLYTDLIKLQFITKTWEFQTLKSSSDYQFDATTTTTVKTRDFDKNLAVIVIDKCHNLQASITELSHDLDTIILYVETLDVREWVSDAGCLLVEMYLTCLRLKQTLQDEILVFYLKAKLILISFELEEITTIQKDLSEEVSSTLISYKGFVSVLLKQLDLAQTSQDAEQLHEITSILQDVEKMFDVVKMNFFYEEELLERSKGYDEELANYRARQEVLQVTSVVDEALDTKPTTLTDELPNLLKAFDKAKSLEKELSSLMGSQIHESGASSPINIASSPQQGTATLAGTPPTNSLPKSPSLGGLGTIREQLEWAAGINKSQLIREDVSRMKFGLGVNQTGFSNPMLNTLYGLHKK